MVAANIPSDFSAVTHSSISYAIPLRSIGPELSPITWPTVLLSEPMEWEEELSCV